jgi:hypothetical protein
LLSRRDIPIVARRFIAGNKRPRELNHGYRFPGNESPGYYH